MQDNVHGMLLAISILCGLLTLGLVAVVHILGQRFTEMHKAVLHHLATTQVIGGQPVDLAREQFQANFSLKSEEARINREAMAAHIARARRPDEVVG